MGPVYLIAVIVAIVHGNVLPLQQIRSIHHLQRAKVFNSPDNVASVVKLSVKEENESVNISNSGIGSCSGSQALQKKAREELQSLHHRGMRKNTQHDGSDIHEELPCICPDEEEFLPCKCNCNTEPGGLIDCSEISDVDQLKIKFQTTDFPVKKYSKFVQSPARFNVLDVPSLPENVFDTIAFKKIYFIGGLFKSVHQEAFISSIDILEELSLTCSEYLTVFPELVEFPYLTRLELSSNAIEILPIVRSQPELVRLFLDSNRIKQVPPNAFESLPKLQILDLGINHLTSLEDNTMNLVCDTPSIYMDHNSINHIDDMAFSGIEERNQPGYLDLANNQLTTLKEPVFRKMLEIVSNLMLDGGGVLASENPLDCKSLTWLINSEELQKYVSVPQCT